MTKFLFSLVSFLLSTKAEFKSYDGSHCGYVYDSDRESTYPLDVCITDYDKDHAFYQYKSRRYVCTQEDDTDAIEVYTYYGQDCSGTPDESRSALGRDNSAYRCGPGTGCYVEYKQYDVGTEDTTCETWADASYETKYLTVGACVPATHKTYSRCDPTGESTDVEYVEFIDDECCHLAYSYTSSSGPRWKTRSIETGCDKESGTYIDADSWKCLMAEDANDKDVFTDNEKAECTDDAQGAAVYGVVMTVVVAVVSIY